MTSLPRKYKSALEEVASIARLDAAWQKTRKRTSTRARESGGIDGISVSDIERSPRYFLEGLRSQVLNGYQFKGLQAHFIPKQTSKERIICVPTVPDRIVQRAILAFLSDGDRCRIENDVSFGYVSHPEKTQQRAAQRAARLRDINPWVLKTDISSFFDCIDREILGHKVRGSIQYRSLHPVLSAAIACEIDERDKKRRNKIKGSGIERGKGVRQGMPLSPFFANLFLNEFDREVQRLGIPTVRYADDLIMFFSHRESAETALEKVKEKLAALNLKIPPISDGGKTRIVGPREPVEFLGAELRWGGAAHVVAVPTRLFATIQQRYMDQTEPEYLKRHKPTIYQLKSSFGGLTDGLTAAYAHCVNHAELTQKLRKFEQEALGAVLKRELRIDVSALNASQKSLLGLTD